MRMVLILLPLLAQISSQKPMPPSGCPLFQCTTDGSNRITAENGPLVTTTTFPLPTTQRLLFARTDATFHSLSHLGCVSNSVNVVCGPQRRQSKSNRSTNNVLSSLDSTGNVTCQLDVGPALNKPRNSPTMPIMDASSSFFWNDAAHILLGDAKGDVLWKNTFDDAVVTGDFYPGTITSGTPEVIVIAMKTGFVFSYNTQGIPVAGIHLANTPTAPNASHVPVAPPIAVNDRVFIVAQAIGSPQRGRIFAYDVRDVAVNRMALVWYVEIPRTASTGAIKTMDLPGATMEPGTVVGNDLVCAGGATQLLIAYNVTKAQTDTDVLIKTVDWKGNAFPKWTALTLPSDIVLFADQNRTGVWAGSQKEGDYLYHIDVKSGVVDRALDLKEMLLQQGNRARGGTQRGNRHRARPVLLTSRLIGFECGDSNDSCVVVATKDDVVVLNLSGKSKIEWVWKIPLDETVTGQIAILVGGEGQNNSTGKRNNVVVVRTEIGVYGLTL